jgi:hypothetical protein
LAATALGLAALGPLDALAQRKDTCVDAHAEAQELRRRGQLRAARERLDVCAREKCPALVRKDCGAWLPEVEAATPSLILEVRDAAGRDTSEVEVLVDGERVAERLDGRAIEVDPGDHVVVVRAADGKLIEQRVSVREGERMRRVTASFEPPAPPKAPPLRVPPPATAADRSPPRGGVSPWAWVLGGVAVVGAGGFVTFAALGRAKQDELDDCRPTCVLDDVDLMRRDYLVADISLGVGVLAAAGALYLILAASPPAKTSLRPASAQQVGFSF